MKRRDVLASLAAAPIALTAIPDAATAGTPPGPAPLAFVEWLLLHPGAHAVDDAPDWVFQVDGPEKTGAFYADVAVRHRDGREFSFQTGIYTRAIDGTPWNTPFDWSVHRELHQRYPGEFPTPPSTDTLRVASDDWEPKIHLDAALDALVAGDMDRYDRRIKDAARAMGATVGDA